jgi:P-type E1-E2 ATPase
MIEITIPGRGEIRIKHLVCDVNGTLAIDGQPIEGVARQMLTLRDRLQIHMLTADTHGKQAEIDRQLNLKAHIIQKGHEAEQKAEFVKSLGAENVVAIGQGANDAAMLITAGIGIAVISEEGLAIETLHAADMLMPDILSALTLLEKPVRLIATLRK